MPSSNPKRSSQSDPACFSYILIDAFIIAVLVRMAPKVQKSKEAKIKAALAGGKGKKKKWSKGKQKDKVENAVMFDKALWDKLTKEIPKAKLITPSIISERIRVNGSLARQAIRVLEQQGQIVRVGEPSSKLQIYTRKVTAATA
jgi:small subunit ribosomal protein S25e